MRYWAVRILSLLALSSQSLATACQDAAPPPMPVTPFVETVESQNPRPQTERRDLPEQGQQFIRGIALMLLPQKFDDDDGWGREKKIQSGLNVDFENGQISTSRRWKHVNHGSWLQGSGELVDPEESFVLKGTQLPDPDAKTQRYEVYVSARLRVTGRQQQWNYGVMLWSISADALADVSLHVVFDVKTEIATVDQKTKLRFQPHTVHAKAQLDKFSLRRISHAKGEAVRGFGKVVEDLIELRIKKENKDLAARINKAIQKKSDHLEVPFDVGGWFGVPPGVSMDGSAVGP